MVDRATKLRWRRRFRRSQKQVETIGQQAEEQLEQHFFKRLGRLSGVGRFVATWIVLFVLLAGAVVVQSRALSRFYQTLQPVPGGVYTEGIVGSFTNANPLYASGAVDASVSKLVFSSLLKYDSENNLVGDLASKMEVDDKGEVYTITLREDAKWQDGKPLTSADVVFTYQTIQKPDAKSPLQPNWQNVSIVAKDERTVVFTLPYALGSFPHSLTNGIVPKHLLENIPPSQLRSISFNTNNPVGSGPFKWEAVQVEGDTPDTREEQIGFVPNDLYYGGAPKLNRFIIRAFHSEERLQQSFERDELTAAGGLDNLPNNAGSSAIKDYSVPLNAEVMVFLKVTNPLLSDKNVRQALVKGTNTAEIVSGLGYPVITAKGPLLVGQVGYSPDKVQFGYDLDAAKKQLDEAGWVVGEDGIRTKDGQRLTFQLYSQSSAQYSYVSQALQQQWKQLGVDLEVVLQPDIDLQSTIAFHNYDALLYGIAVGSDPDVYVYWHSSQADIRSSNRLNFSELNSKVVDTSLEAGRSRLDAALRAAKYQPFLETWRDQAPAIALYQPRYLYVTNDKVYGFNPTTFNNPTDRYANVSDWMIREEYVSIY